MVRRMLTFDRNIPRRLAAVTSLAAAFLLVGASCALARAYLPPPGQSFQGVAGGGGQSPVFGYERAVGKHPAVYEVSSAWGEYLPGMFTDAAAAQARLMIYITTASGNREMITPGAIAAGRGDAWLIALNRAIAASRHPVYIRLMAEMDGSWNPYSAYNANGTPRDGAHSTAAFRRAWKRATLILRGGSLEHIDHVLAGLGMPALHSRTDLPVAKVALLWAPQVAGSPAVPGNQPSAYWPGRAWADWVGTDVYSKFPNFAGLDAFYREFDGLPFAFGELAMGSDEPGFVSQLFAWLRSHPRTRMLVYNQGFSQNGPFQLSRYPLASRVLRTDLSGARYPAYALDWLPAGLRAPVTSSRGSAA